MRRIVKKTKSAVRQSFAHAASAVFPQWFNKRFCATEGMWNTYFTQAEQDMAASWDQVIWPNIKDFDFNVVLELAPGAGRNTEKLAQVAREIHAVDLNEYALRRLRDRFQSYSGRCKLTLHQNRGSDLAMIGDSAITLIYCWDAAVHFDKAVVNSYVNEFARVLKPEGVGFIHHSNLGARAQSDIRRNPHWRSNMTKDLFAQYCERNRLELLRQLDLPWGEGASAVVDCISVFRKPFAG